MGYDEGGPSDCLEHDEYRRLEREFRAALRKFVDGERGNGSTDLSRAAGTFYGFGKGLSSSISSGRRERAVRTLARLIVERLLVNEVRPEVQSVVLMALARWQYEAAEIRRSITGSQVSWFGPVISNVSEKPGGAEACVRWFCDMGLGLVDSTDGDRPGDGSFKILPPQSIRMLRGLLHRTRPGDPGMQEFWVSAARSSFPSRIFTQPGDHDRHSCYLTDWHISQLAGLFDQAPIPATRNFAGFLSRQVWKMKRLAYGQVRLPGGRIEQGSACDWDWDRDGLSVLFPGNDPRVLERIAGFVDESGCNPDLTIWELEVPVDKRPQVLRAILHRMEDRSRRQLVAEIFHL